MKTIIVVSMIWAVLFVGLTAIDAAVERKEAVVAARDVANLIATMAEPIIVPLCIASAAGIALAMFVLAAAVSNTNFVGALVLIGVGLYYINCIKNEIF